MELVEKIIAATLLSGGVVSAWATGFRPATLLFLAPNLFVLTLVLIRRKAAQISDSPLDWALPLAASAAPQLLVAVSTPPMAPGWLALGAMASGGLLSLFAIIVLGRSFGIFPANRGVKRWGPYALVRHPMYLGYALWQLGFVLANPGIGNALVLGVAFGLQAWRVKREERVLLGDPLYRSYCQRVRAKFIPLAY